MISGGDSSVIKKVYCDIQTKAEKRAQCEINVQNYYDLACGGKLFKTQCEDFLNTDVISKLDQVCGADRSNKNDQLIGQCVYMNLDESYGDKRKSFTVDRWRADGAMFASNHLEKIKSAKFAPAQPGAIFTAVEGNITNPIAKTNLKSLIQKCNSATGKEAQAQQLLADVLSALSGNMPTLESALLNYNSPINVSVGGVTYANFAQVERAIAGMVTQQVNPQANPQPTGSQSHIPSWRARLGLNVAPDGGYGEAKDGQDFNYDNLNGKLLKGFPFLHASLGLNLSVLGMTAEADAFQMLSVSLDWARGQAVDVANPAEGSIDTGDNVILGLAYSSHRFLSENASWYWTGALRWHRVSNIPRGPNLGPGGVSQPGLYAGLGAEWYFRPEKAPQTHLFAELGVSWSCNPENLLSDADRAADPELANPTFNNCYRTEGGTPVVPSLRLGIGW